MALTRREREILGSLAEGMSGAQIAEKLVLSPETVRTHVRNAMAKLGASTRSQAVALALQQRVISADPEGAAIPEPQAAPPADSEPRADRGPDRDALPAWSRSTTSTAAPSTWPTRTGWGWSEWPPPTPSAEHLELPSSGRAWRGRARARGARAARPALQASRERRHRGAGRLIAAPMIGNGRLIGVIALAHGSAGRSAAASCCCCRRSQTASARSFSRRRRRSPSARPRDAALPRHRGPAARGSPDAEAPTPTRS